MKKNTITIVLFLSITVSFSQTITSEFITGSWMVDSVEIKMLTASPEQKMQLREMGKGLVKTRFIFKQDDSFEIIYPESGVPSFLEEVFPKGLQLEWVFYDNNKSIAIGTSEDNFSLMGLLITTYGSDIYFKIEESDIILKMKKM